MNVALLSNSVPALAAAFALVGALTACGGGVDSSNGGAAGAGASHGGAAGAGASNGGAAGAGASTTGGGGQVCGPDVTVPDEVVVGTKDPTGGVFTLDQALEDLPEGPGPLRAIITTDLGELSCELRPDVVPISVANFVGLARGRRPWRDPKAGHWVKRAFYDGLIFHRVIPAFMIQGGDPLGTGMGGPGYKFDDELAGLHHEPGTLAYANSGPNTNGSQFYVTEVKTDWLDADYTIFGLCTPVNVVTSIAAVARDANDKPLVDVHMQTIRITRCAP